MSMAACTSWCSSAGPAARSRRASKSTPSRPVSSRSTKPADVDLFAILLWMVDGIGGGWTAEALQTTGRIYRITAAG
jgi:hypothetical protein